MIEVPPFPVIGNMCMNVLVVTTVAALALLLTSCQNGRPDAPGSDATAPPTLAGRVLLPAGVGNRGVEVVVTFATLDPDRERQWVVFDTDGRFEAVLYQRPIGAVVTAGHGVIRRFGADRLERDEAGRIDLGEIDLRDALDPHRIVVRAADGRPAGDVRVAMWSGSEPPAGVALGSRQFPPVPLGSELEWLLPPDATDVHFLVERPADAGRGEQWQTGPQRRFGPFTAATVPAELVLD